MNSKKPRFFSAGTVARALLTPKLLEHTRLLNFDDRGYGFDRFGMNADWVAVALALMRPLYEQWFRVSSTGHEHIPKHGAAIIAANHSGALPFDAMMMWTDIVRKTDPARVPRTIADYFVTLLPFVSTLFTRAGAVGGNRGNVHQLLADGDLVLLFPEGVPGISKRFDKRYQLQKWRGGHVEMAIRHGCPVVPAAVVGAEEQMPTLAQLPLRAFGAPHLPLIATGLLPLPVRYHLYYGAPIPVHEDYPPEAADDPAALREAAARVKDAVQLLIMRGLKERPGVFQ